MIVAHEPRSGQVVALLIYNAVWFALPIVALVTCIVRSAMRPGTSSGGSSSGPRSLPRILLVASFGVGVALVIRGALAL